MDKLDIETSHLVKSSMQREKVSATRLAKTTGISKTTLLRRLSAEASFTIRELGTIARALNCHHTDLFPTDNKPSAA